MTAAALHARWSVEWGGGGAQAPRMRLGWAPLAQGALAGLCLSRLPEPPPLRSPRAPVDLELDLRLDRPTGQEEEDEQWEEDEGEEDGGRYVMSVMAQQRLSCAVAPQTPGPGPRSGPQDARMLGRGDEHAAPLMT